MFVLKDNIKRKEAGDVPFFLKKRMFKIDRPENTHPHCKGKYHCTVDLLFGWFGFSSFVTMKLSSHLLVWMNPNRQYKGTIAMTTI